MPKKIVLTDAKFNSVKPRKDEFTLWDKNIPGLGLRVRPNGSKRFIYLREGKKITLAAVSADSARDECLGMFLDRKTMQNKGHHFRRITLGDYVEQEWKKQSADIHAPETKRKYRFLLKNQILPVFAEKYLHEITKPQVLKWFEKESRHAAGAANHALKLLKRILNMAKRDSLIRLNPTDGIDPNPSRPIMRYLSTKERKDLLYILARREKSHPKLRPNCDIIRLLMLTGCRRSEIVGLKWAWIREREIHLPYAKTGARVVWISKEAQEIIARQPKTGSEFIFPHPHDPNRPCPFSWAFWQTTKRMTGLDDVRVHDLRHSFASHAMQQGVPLPVISKLLGHAGLRMTLRYAHVSDKATEAAAERVGASIGGLLQEKREISGKFSKKY